MGANAPVSLLSPLGGTASSVSAASGVKIWGWHSRTTWWLILAAVVTLYIVTESWWGSDVTTLEVG